MKKLQKTVDVKIPAILKEEIEYYISQNKTFANFEELLIYYLNQGLQSEILGTMSRLERSYRCRDLNPKTVRRVYDTLREKSEFFLCDECKSDPVFDKYESEEKIRWGNWKIND